MSRSLKALIEDLGSHDDAARIAALKAIVEIGVDAARDLASVIADGQASVTARAWAMLAVMKIGPPAAPLVRSALVECLGADHPSIRR